jgi:hypothetical protein
LLRAGSRELLEVLLFAILAYTTATALVTSLSRIYLGTDQAFASRYQSFALLFWLALTLWIFVAVDRRQLRGLLLVMTAVMVAGTSLSAYRFSAIREEVAHRIFERNVAGIALITGVHDEPLLTRSILPFPVNWSDVEYLHRSRMSLFQAPMALVLGNSFSGHFPERDDQICLGFVDEFTAIPGSNGGTKIQGWAADRSTRRPIHNVVFVADDAIVGVGVTGMRREDVARTLHSGRTLFSGWSGYAEPSAGISTLQVYAIPDLTGKQACHLERSRIADPAH